MKRITPWTRVALVAITFLCSQNLFAQWSVPGPVGNSNIYTNGNVGIKRAAQYPLDILGNTRLTGDLMLDNNANTTNKSRITSYGYSGAIEFKNNVGSTGYDVRYLRLGMQDNLGTFYPRISIVDNGYVGIGNINPLYPLDVIGNARLIGNLQMENNSDGKSKISGYGYSGAIEIKNNVGVGGYDARYLRLGMQDNNGTFLPRISIIDNGNV
jgi:hypothetical protein